VCNISLASGVNVIQAQAVDAAGNMATSAPLSVTYAPITPTAIFITPTVVNMVAGQSRTVKLFGNPGQPVFGATWTISDSTIASITTNDPPRLTAIAQGTATLTASLNGLTATMTVNVLPGTSLPAGTVLWSIEPTGGGTIGGMVHANPINAGDPDIYVVDGATTLRAFTADGQQLWATQVVGASPGGSGNSTALLHQPNQQQTVATRSTPSNASALWKQTRRASGMPDPFDRVVAEREKLLQRMHETGSGTVHSATAPTSAAQAASPGAVPSDETGFTFIRQAVADNSGGAILVLSTCLDVNCNTFMPTLTRVDNGSQQQTWSHQLTDGPFDNEDPGTGAFFNAIAIGPDNTVYASGAFVTGPAGNLGTPTNAVLVVLDGVTGQQKQGPQFTPSVEHLVTQDSSGGVLTDDSITLAPNIGPMAVMQDGSLRALVASSHVAKVTRNPGTDSGGNVSPCGDDTMPKCATSFSDHLDLKLLTVQPDGTSSTQSVQAFAFDASGCTAPSSTPFRPCGIPLGSPGAYFPQSVIPDGLGGILALYETESTDPASVGKFTAHSFVRHIDSSGATQDYAMGFALNEDLGFPGDLVLGENNVAFGSAAATVAFDVTTGAIKWQTSQISDPQELIVGATSGGGLATLELASRPFGPVDALKVFDTSGASTASPFSGGASYFEDSTLMSFAGGNAAELIISPANITIDPAGVFNLPQGNKFAQRAPAPPQIDSLSISRGLAGDTLTVSLEGAQLSKVKSVDAGPGINVTVDTSGTATDRSLKTTFKIARAAEPGAHKITATLEDGAKIDSKQDFFVQIPTSLRVISVTVLPDGPEPPAGCSAHLPYGIKVDIKYQVLDQESKEIQSGSMTPHEKGTFATGGSFDGNIGPAPGFPTSSLTTAPDGTFHDVPLGRCREFPISTGTTTQSITMILPDGTSSPVVRQQEFNVRAPGAASFEHGTITNSIKSPGSGSDVNAER
jgi:hypothetical protein